MADVEDVAAALADLVAGFVTGTGGVPLTGVQTDIVTGWPRPNDLKDTLADGGVMISVFPLSGATSNVTRHQWEWETVMVPEITATADVEGGTITFGGAIVLPFNICVTAPGCRAASYAAVAGETPESLAAAVAAALRASGEPTVASGAQVITGRGGPLTVTLGGSGVLAREAAREKQVFRITTWASSQALRLATAKVFEAKLLALTRIRLPDGTIGTPKYMRTIVSDHGELESEYRRDLDLFVEYPIIETISGTTVVSEQLAAA